jgi:hypothetical protein
VRYMNYSDGIFLENTASNHIIIIIIINIYGLCP